MVNTGYAALEANYLFSEIARRIEAFSAEQPDKRLIRMGIGDVTLPLCSAVTDAITAAAGEMATREGFHGYGPEQGYGFLREAIRCYYSKKGIELETSEIFVSDGAKSDLGNILDIFSRDIEVLVPDPVYPVYVDTNIMDGRKISYANANQENGFLPMPDGKREARLIYLCSPNNPTGATYSADQLKQWVDYANETGSVILFDAAYEAFIVDDSPSSIFFIEGARTCAIEFCSLSKTAGFTGTRCGYTVVPEALVRDGMSLRAMWLRRQSTKFNGVSYVIQRAAEAVFSDLGQSQIRGMLEVYRRNAKVLSEALDRAGVFYTGGKNSPYLWLRCPSEMSSWDFFDLLLRRYGVVGTPGSGFGANGEGFFRLTAFSDEASTKTAAELIFAALTEN